MSSEKIYISSSMKNYDYNKEQDGKKTYKTNDEYFSQNNYGKKNYLEIDIENLDEREYLKNVFQNFGYEYIGKRIEKDDKILTRMFYDIDISYDSEKDIDTKQDKFYKTIFEGEKIYTEESFYRFRDSLLDFFKENNDKFEYYRITDGSYFESPEKFKLSFHIIFPNFYVDKKVFENTEEFEKYMKFFIGQDDDYQIKEFVDKSVYGKKYLFRLPLFTDKDKPFPHNPIGIYPLKDYLLTMPVSKIKRPIILEMTPKENRKRECANSRERECANSCDDPTRDEFVKIVALGEEEKEFLTNIVNLFSESRAFEYKTWMNVLWGIYNITNGNDFGRDLFLEFSKKSKKYDEDSCLDHWNKTSVKDGGINMGSLRMWAKEDNKIEYEKIIRQCCLEDSSDNMDYKFMKNEFEKTHTKIVNLKKFYKLREVDFDMNYIEFSKKDISDMYENKHYTYFKLKKTKIGVIEGVPQYKEEYIESKASFIKTWLLDENMRSYEQTTFKPYPLEIKKDELNLWTDFRIKRIYDSLTKEQKDAIDINISQILLNHIMLLSNNNIEIYNYLITYIAHMIQYPALRSNICIYIKSKQGLGKGILHSLFAKLFGEEKCLITSRWEKDIVGDFNSMIKNKILITLDEMNSASKKYEDKLKEIITGETISIEKKGKDPEKLPCFFRTFMFSNNEFAIKVDTNDRRFCLIESDVDLPEKSYFDNLLTAIDDTQIQLSFYKLMMSIQNVKNYDFRTNRPKTDLVANLKITSLSPEIQYLVDTIFSIDENNQNELPFTRYSDFLSNFRTSSFNISGYTINPIGLGIKLGKSPFDKIINADRNMSSRGFSIKDIKLAKSILKENGIYIHYGPINNEGSSEGRPRGASA